MPSVYQCGCGRPKWNQAELCKVCRAKKLLEGRQGCTHCKTRVAARARGLCWPCSNMPEIRRLYQCQSKYANRGLGTGRGGRLADETTDAFPGTPEKLSIMQERAARNEAVCHYGDAQRESA
jgi:hypothetical protein